MGREVPDPPAPRVKVVRAVVTLAAEERVLEARELVSEEMAGSGVEAGSMAMPVRAWKISAVGGSASSQGTVKSGLSQRLWVLGSS